MLSSTHPSTISSRLPIALDGTLLGCLTVCSQESSQVHLRVRSQVHLRIALLYTPEHALLYTPNCTRWYTPGVIGSTLPNTLSRGKTLPISLDYMLPCMLLRARSRDLLSCRRQAPGGVKLVVYGGQCLAGGGRRVACGVWQVAGGVCWPKS